MKRKMNLLDFLWPSLAALSVLAALFFRFALIGYSFTALILFGAAVFFTALWLLSRLERRRPRGAKHLRRALLALFILGALLFTAAEIPVILASRGDREDAADYLIVLGAGVNGTVPSLSMINRLVTALDYLNRYPEAKVVVTGGQGPGESIPEAEAMRIWLERQGVAPGRILKEDKSTSTYENLLFALELIKEDGGGSLAIASSEYHLYRAQKIASLLGAETVGVPAKTTILSLKINHFMREAFGVIHMWVFGFQRSGFAASLSFI